MKQIFIKKKVQHNALRSLLLMDAKSEFVSEAINSYKILASRELILM